MIEISAPLIEVWLCAADPARLTTVPAVLGIRLSVAPDELHVVCEPHASGLVRSALAHAAGESASSRVFDVTGAWHARLLTGDRPDEAFSLFVSHSIPAHRPCFVQGRANGVASRAIVTDDAVLVLVASIASHAFDARLPSMIKAAHAPPASALQRLIEQCRAEVVL